MPVSGLVGPKAPSDPQDRLRQLLLAGARETQRQQRKPLKTGSACKTRTLPASLRGVHVPLQTLPADPELERGHARLTVGVLNDIVVSYPKAGSPSPDGANFTFAMMDRIPASRLDKIRAALNAYIETNNLTVSKCEHTNGSDVINHLLALKTCLAEWEAIFFAGMGDLVKSQSATVLPSATRTAGGQEHFAYDIAPLA